jgi:hypothetical protein
MDDQTPSESGIYQSVLDGPSAAYLCLAYDLYVLAHHGLLQSVVVRRLKSRDDFRSARYELFVAATLLRAGFSIEFEDETDSTRKHPEFIATHRVTGQRIAVEAKSKWRRGVIEWKLGSPPDEEFRLNIGDLLLDAITKQGDDPLVVFIDANMPPQIAIGEQERWLRDVADSLGEVARRSFDDSGSFTGVPFSALFITNSPHDYAGPGESDPPRIGFLSQPLDPVRRLAHPQVLRDIESAVTQYGNTPQDFPDSGSNAV